MRTAIPYKITTPRSTIRCYEERDAAMLKISIDETLPNLLPFMPWAKDEPQTVQQKVERIQRMRREFSEEADFTMGIFNHNETELLGSTGLHRRIGEEGFEIGFWINARHEGKGLVSEVVQALTKAVFVLTDYPLMQITCDARNIRSANVCGRNGYRLVEVVQAPHPKDETLIRQTMYWQMTREQFLRSHFVDLSISCYDAQGKCLHP